MQIEMRLSNQLIEKADAQNAVEAGLRDQLAIDDWHRSRAKRDN